MRVKGVVMIGHTASPFGAAPCSERVANRAIVCHALDSLATAGVEELAVACPSEAMADARACIEAELGSEPKITWLAQPERDDLWGALVAAASFVGDGACVAHPADGLLGGELGAFVELASGTPPDLLLLLHRSAGEGQGLGSATRKLLGVSDIDGSRGRLALTGACVFGPDALRRVAAMPAPHGETDLLEVAQLVAGQARPLEAGVVRTWRSYQGDPLDLLELNRIVLDQQPAPAERPDRGNNRIEGRVIIDPSAQVNSSIVLGPSIIGARALITNSYIGPYTSVGPGAEIDNAEIVRSIVSEGARIRNVGGRIEGSTIGRGASIFRDFGLPRAMRLHVGEGVELALN